MPARLTDRERIEVLALARRAVEAAAAGHPVDTPAPEGALAIHAGAFVSLHRAGVLRGCIGHIEGDRTLAHVISSCAAAAATDDPRFPPVASDEVPDLDIEVSVLAGIERVSDIAHIEVGRHGLIVEQQRHKGLLLPQVATEHGWDRLTFLSHTCRKAGLTADAWKTGATVYRFEAEVFGEAD
jgi:AmmeMemoRadiSam system protein A